MSYQIAKTTFGPVSYRRMGQGQKKILFFHGFPGSSRQIDIFKPELQSHDLDVVCFDRPGYHHSEIKTEDSLNVTTKIAMELVSALSWNQFEIVTVSGGTPFGIGLALQHSNSVTGIRVISGLGDLTVKSVRTNFPAVSFLGLKVLPFVPTKIIKNALQIKPGKRNTVIDFFLPPSKADYELGQNANVRDSLNQSLNEALEQGFLGPKQDTSAFLSHWSAGAKELKIPIHFWHGEMDNVISYKISESMAPLFPNGKMTLVKNHGHLSLPITLIGQILKFDFASRS